MCQVDFDGDTWKTWNERVVAPRPKQTCDACDQPLPAAEPFYSIAYLYESSWSRERACFACWWSKKAFEEAHGIVLAPSMLWERLHECIGENNDPLDVWRPHFAALKRRCRISPSGRRQLRRDWADRRERLRRIVLARDGFGAPP